MSRASYDELICRTSLTFTECILHTLAVPQHVPSYGSLYRQRAIRRGYDYNYEDSLMIVCVVCRNMLRNW